MKHIKSLLCAILAAVFILAPAALAAESAHDAVNPAACSHSWGSETTFASYESISTKKHNFITAARSTCLKCGITNIRIIRIMEQNHHKALMYKAVCGGEKHYYDYKCETCLGYMYTLTVPCPRPGNCPGLPLSMILLPK